MTAFSRYRERLPVTAPRRFVACVWTREVAGGTHRQRVVPDGCVDLMWLDGTLVVAGPDCTPRTVALPGGSYVAGVRFRPGAAGMLLGRMPTWELRDLMVPLAELMATTARLEDRLAQAGDAQTAAAILESSVAAPSAEFRAEPAVEQAVRALGRTSAPRLPELADELGWSERQLRRLITDAVGYGPQTLQSVLRFQRAMELAWSGVAFAEVAARAGYADQAHFSREVRRFAGVTPTELFGGSG